MATPNYDGAVQAADQQRAKAIQRLSQLAQARQKWVNKMYERQMADMKRAEEEREKFGPGSVRSGIGKALGGALTGAATGFVASGFNPMGALAGGVGGLALGAAGGLSEKYLGTDLNSSGLAGIAAQGLGGKFAESKQTALGNFQQSTSEQDQYNRSLLELQRQDPDLLTLGRLGSAFKIRE